MAGTSFLRAAIFSVIAVQADGVLDVTDVHWCPVLEIDIWIVLQVYGLPTLVLFKDGEVVKGSQKEGALGKAAILKYLEKYEVLPQTAQ